MDYCDARHEVSYKMYKMGCSRLQCKWQEMAEVPSIEHVSSLALVIPDDFVDCTVNEEHFWLGIVVGFLGGFVCAQMAFARISKGDFRSTSRKETKL